MAERIRLCRPLLFFFFFQIHFALFRLLFSPVEADDGKKVVGGETERIVDMKKGGSTNTQTSSLVKKAKYSLSYAFYQETVERLHVIAFRVKGGFLALSFEFEQYFFSCASDTCLVKL